MSALALRPPAPAAHGAAARASRHEPARVGIVQQGLARGHAVRLGRGLTPLRASGCPPGGAEPVSGVELSTVEDFDYEQEWTQTMIRMWLDEEWAGNTPGAHEELAAAAAEIYANERRRGNEELSSIVLAIGTGLLTFDFSEQFVGGFDVANKISELLLMRDGVDVCCTTDEDRTAIERFETAWAEEKAAAEA